MTQAQTQPDLDVDVKDVVVKAMGLNKIFKDFWHRDKVRAVDSIDFEIRRGEVFGLLGPNGSGKSTTIKLILGLLHPTGGKLAVFGKLPRDVQAKKRIGYLPEETYLYRFLTPVETLEYYGKLFHLDRRTRRNRIEMLLDMVGLEHAANRPVGEFSKGMMRKVGLAQALINDPELLILDEPTSGMDPIASDDVKKVIRSLRERGKTILLCSHLLADVQDVCDRVAMMFGGKIRRAGDLDSLLLVQDKTTITTSTLDKISDEQIIAALERLGVTDVTLDHPRRTLEQVFLEMVEEAQRQGVKTFGARSGRNVAAFLQGEDGDPAMAEQRETIERDVLIESLVSGEAEAPEQAQATPAQAPAATAAPSASAAVKAESDDVLAELTGQAPPEPEKKTPAASSPTDSKQSDSKPGGQSPNQPDKPKADEGVIDDLLNG